MSKHVLIIGGGVIGLMSAYYLMEAGHRVSVADQTTMTDGCSYGNAGLVAPSHVVPLASPGMVSTAIRYMFSSTSPLYFKPRPDRHLINWAWNFYRFSTRKHVLYAVPHLKNISLLSKELYNDLTKNFDFGYKEAGLLMLFRTGRGEKMEVEAAALAQKKGVVAAGSWSPLIFNSIGLNLPLQAGNGLIFFFFHIRFKNR